MPEHPLIPGIEGSGEPEGDAGEPQGTEQKRRDSKTRAREQAAEARAERDQAYEVVNLLSSRQDDLAEKLDQVLERLNGSGGREEPAESPSGDPWAKMTDDGLAAIISNDEYVQNQPSVVQRALLELASRNTRREVDRARKELRQEVTSENQTRDRLAEVRGQILREYGVEALTPNSKLFQRASLQYEGYEHRHGGKGSLVKHPEYLYFSVQQAARALGMDPQGSAADDDSVDVNQQPTTRRRELSRPAPADLQEGPSEGSAPERDSTYRRQIEEKDTAGAIGTLTERLLGMMPRV